MPVYNYFVTAYGLLATKNINPIENYSFGNLTEVNCDLINRQNTGTISDSIRTRTKHNLTADNKNRKAKNTSGHMTT
jgi:hypothetical protein